MEAVSRVRFAERWNSDAQPSEAIRAELHPDAWMLTRILDEIDYGVLLVDAAAQLLYANTRAMHDCSVAAGLQIDRGLVKPQHALDACAFGQALQASRQGRRTLLTLRAATTPSSVAVVPLGSASATLLMLSRRAACEPLSVELFAHAHRLTAAESAVLRSLAAGLKPAQIARQGGVSIATIRTQISGIRAKTSTASIRDLVHRVAALPPITPALYKPTLRVGS